MSHSKFRRVIALTVILCMAITSMPAIGYAAVVPQQSVVQTTEELEYGFKGIENYSPDPEETKEFSEVTEVDIIAEESTEDITTYDLGNGNRVSVFYSYNVRYEDEEGNLVEYDPELIEVTGKSTTEQGVSLTGYEYENKQGDFKNYIPETPSESTPIIMEHDKYSITMTPTGYLNSILAKSKSKGKGKLKDDVVRTIDHSNQNKKVKMVFGEETDEAYLEYISLNEGIKENIILNEVPKKNEFTFKLTLKGLTYGMDESGGITFYDEVTGDIVAGIEAPFMNDATGNAYSEDIVYTMERKGNSDNYTLTVTVDEEYLNSGERVYPVTIDPTMTWDVNSGFREAYVSSGSPNTNYYGSSYKVMPSGRASNGNKYRTYIKFLNLKSTLKGATISSATLNCYENGDGIPSQVVRVYKLLTDWDYTDVTWNTVPDHGTASSYLDAITSSGVANRKQSWDITDWVQDVVMDDVSNYGIAIKNQVEASESYAEFYGTRSTSTAYRPYLAISYTADKPAVPDVTSVSGSYIHTEGSNVALSWSGLTCNYLDHVEYKIVKADSNWNAGETLVEYTDLVTTSSSSGSAVIPGMRSLGVGYYNVHIRGVSEMGTAGTGRIYGVRIVKDKPGMPTVTAASSTYPVGSPVVVNWSGLTGNNVTKAQYRIELSNEDWETVEYGLVPYTTFRTNPPSSGSVTIPDSEYLEPGYYKIYIRGVNSSNVHGVGYGCRVQILEDAVPEVGTITFKKGTNILDEYEYVSPGNITVTASGMYDDKPIIGSNLWYLLSKPGDPYIYDTLDGYTVTKSGTDSYDVSFTIPAAEVQETGIYGLYFEVSDNAGNSAYDIPLFWIDATAPTGSLSTSLVATAEASDVLEGMALLTINVNDAHSGVGNSAVTLYKGTKDNVGEQVAVLASDSSLQKIVALDSAAYEDGNYTMKLVVTDKVGNTATFWKDISIDNRMTKPTVGVSVAEGNAALDVQWGYQSEMAELDYLQYNLDNAETWTDVAITNKTNGSFAVPLPTGASGTHTLLVRGVDVSGEYGETSRTDFNIDTTNPVVVITDINRGIVTGTVTDDYLASWTISVKERDNADAEFAEIATGTKAVTAGRIGIADLSSSQYAADTWYTVKVEASDEVGNKSSDTFEVYKDASYKAATLVVSENRILRSLGQDQQLSNFIVSSTEDALEMKNGNLFASALWIVNDTVVSTVKNYAANFASYVDGVLNNIAAVGKDSSGNVFYSNDVYLDAAEETFTFGTAVNNQVEQTITLTQEAVAFKLNAPANVAAAIEAVDQEVTTVTGENTVPEETMDPAEGTEPAAEEAAAEMDTPLESAVLGMSLEPEEKLEEVTVTEEEAISDEAVESDEIQIAETEVIPTEEPAATTSVSSGSITYYAKVGDGEYQLITPDTLVHVYNLNNQMISTNSITIKAVADNAESLAQLDTFTVSLGVMDEETFSVSSAEGYWPENISAQDKINYKTYVRWNTPETMPAGLSYEVHRSTISNFVPSELTLVAEDLTDGYWVDINTNYSISLYYKVRAVIKDSNGNIVSASSYSDLAESTPVDQDEYIKALGHKDYWAYADVATPSGSGYIEKSQGNFLYEQTDAEMENEQLPVAFTRTYNSMASSKSSLGYGWTHSYDIELLKLGKDNNLDEGVLVLRDGSGTLYQFKADGNTYISSLGKYVNLVKEDLTEVVALPDTTGTNQTVSVTVKSAYTMTTRDNVSYRFNESGKLVYMEEANGNILLFGYDSQRGLMNKITTGNNISIGFEYNNSVGGNDALTIKQMTLPDGQTVLYDYEESKLTKVTKLAAGQVSGGITYSYGYNTNRKMTSLTDAKANAYTITYADAVSGEAKKFTYPGAGSSAESIQITRDETNKVTTTEKLVGAAVVKREKDYFDGAGLMIHHEAYSNPDSDADVYATSYEYMDNLLVKEISQITYSVLSKDADTGVGTISTATAEKIKTYTYDEGGEELLTGEVNEGTSNGTYIYGNTGLWNRHLPTRYVEYVEDCEEPVVDEEYEYDAYGNMTLLKDNVAETVTVYEYYTGASDKAKGAVKSEKQYLLKNGTYSSATLISSTDTTFDYGTNGTKTETVTTVSEGNKTVTETVYDVMGRITSEITYTYTGFGTAAQTIRKEAATYQYDGYGRLIESEITKSMVDSNLTDIADTVFTETQFREYDDNGTLTEETAPDGITTRYTYDALNRVKETEKLVDGISKGVTITNYGYENVTVNSGKPVKDTYTNAFTTTQTVDGNVISKTYQDGLGRTVKSTSYGVTTDYSYDPQGNKVTEMLLTDAAGNGRLTYHVLDEEGRETATLYNPEWSTEKGTFIIDADTIAEITTYDKNGNVISTTDGEGNVTEFTYDEQGRLVKVILADGTDKTNATTFAYAENVTSSGNYTSTVTMTDAMGGVSVETSDASGNIIKVSDQGKPGEGETPIETTFTYDAKGNLLKEVHKEGDYITYAYDSKDRLATKTQYNVGGSAVYKTAYTYYGNDLVKEMLDYTVSGSTETLYRYTYNQYDGLNRLIKFAEINSNTVPTSVDDYAVTYTYDLNDNVTEIAYGNSIGSEVDAMKYVYTNNNLTEVKVKVGTAYYTAKKYTYNTDGSVATVEDYYNFRAGDTANHIKLSYGYDAFGRIASMVYTKGADTVESHIYQYDKNNNIIQENNVNTLSDTKLNEVRYYKYNHKGELTNSSIKNIVTTLKEVEIGEADDNGNIPIATVSVTEEIPVLTTIYTYDKVGNRVKKVENGVTTIYGYNTLNQLETESGENVLTYDYNKNGHLIKVSGTEGGTSVTKTYTYTPEGMLSTYSSGSDSQVNLYNGNGQRVKKTEGSDVTNYFYQNDSVLYTTDTAGTMKSFNLLNVADAFATSRIDGSSESYYFYTEDQRGSTVNVLDSTGSKVVSYWYNDFGEVIESKATNYSSFNNEIQYTGGIYDELTGLLYLNARFYDPSTGRFITQDTYRGERNNANTWHLYAYCANNPINMVDPSGHSFTLTFAVGTAVLGGAYLLASYVNTPAFKSAWKNITNTITDIFNDASKSVKENAQSLVDSIGASYAKAKKKYRTNEVHHIVAQNALRAKTARWVFKKVGKTTNDADNLVPLKKGLHRRLHRTKYYAMVNSMMKSAYYKKSGKGNIAKKRENVEENLGVIRGFLLTLNEICPF